jgi:hypothetical protein
MRDPERGGSGYCGFTFDTTKANHMPKLIDWSICGGCQINVSQNPAFFR